MTMFTCPACEQTVKQIDTVGEEPQMVNFPTFEEYQEAVMAWKNKWQDEIHEFMMHHPCVREINSKHWEVVGALGASGTVRANTLGMTCNCGAQQPCEHIALVCNFVTISPERSF